MYSLGDTHTIEPTGFSHTATVIFLHDSGDTGKGIMGWIKYLYKDFSSRHIRYLFPTSPVRPDNSLGGMSSNIWFDGKTTKFDVPENDDSIIWIQKEVKKIIDEEIKNGIPLCKIIIGGYGSGGALALHMGYRFVPGLAGVFALSTFLGAETKLFKNFKGGKTPLYMCHGERDEMIPLCWGKTTYDQLAKLGVRGEFIKLSNTFHELKTRELSALLEWIEHQLPYSKKRKAL